MRKTLCLTGFSLLALAGALAACSPEKPWMLENSSVVEQPLQLVEGRSITKKPLNAFSDDDVSEAARVYAKNGAGPLYFVIAYKDHGKMGDAQIAAKKAHIESHLMKSGVSAKDINASLVPLETDQPVALIAFDTLEATGPAGCTMPTPGYSTNTEPGAAFGYKVGCGVKNVMARQVANPTDLEGRAGLSGGAYGDHVADVVNGQYRPGAEPKAYLPSYIISEMAQSGN